MFADLKEARLIAKEIYRRIMLLERWASVAATKWKFALTENRRLATVARAQ